MNTSKETLVVRYSDDCEEGSFVEDFQLPAKAQPQQPDPSRACGPEVGWPAKMGFSSSKPLEKGVTGITEIKGSEGKLYALASFDCYDRAVLGLAIWILI